MKEIITALNAAYKECGYVQKQKGKDLGYKFASESAFIEALRPVLIKNGIVVFQSGCEVITTEGYKTSRGNNMNRIIARFEFTFAHTSGESVKVTALAEGADTGDKTAPKCNTGALKYALRQTLLIETGDDPDATDSREQERAPEPKPDPNRPKAQATMEAIRSELAVLSDFDLAAWLMDDKNAQKVKQMRYMQQHYPDIYAELEGLGVDLTQTEKVN